MSFDPLNNPRDMLSLYGVFTNAQIANATADQLRLMQEQVKKMEQERQKLEQERQRAERETKINEQTEACKCLQCNGTGKITKQCKKCEGIGQTVDTVRGYLPATERNKQGYSDMRVKKCYSCNGTGIEQLLNKPSLTNCPNCGGRGTDHRRQNEYMTRQRKY